eukprot:scaffold4736_cov118-Isochrysis_galbana.AAC.3
MWCQVVGGRTAYAATQLQSDAGRCRQSTGTRSHAGYSARPLFVGGWFKAACTTTAWGLGLERLGECGAILCPPYLDPLRADYGWVLSE